MLEAHTHIIEHLQHTHAEAQLLVHHILLDMDDRKPFFPRDAGNDAFAVAVGRGNNHRTGVGRPVGIADIDGNTR